jgi:hypothetical protein
MSSISLSNCSPPAQPIRILIADRNCMGSQLLAESLNHDSRLVIAKGSKGYDRGDLRSLTPQEPFRYWGRPVT